MKNNIMELLKNVEVEWKPFGTVAEIFGGLSKRR